MSKDKSKKEYKALTVYQFFNEYAWEFGRRWPDTGSYPMSWSPRELELSSMGKGWVNYLVLNMGDRFAQIGLRYGTPCLQWDTLSLHYNLKNATKVEDVHFTRWWLDELIRKNSNALWNHVFNTVLRHEHNENTARTQADSCAKEFETPYL